MNIEFRRWSGGINFTGIGLNDVITISGEMGTIDLGSATAGTVEVRGTYKAITNGASGVTVNLAGAILGGDVATILADTNELQTDDIPALIATAQTDLDTLTGTDGVTLATAQGLYAPAKAGDAMTLNAAGIDLIWDETMAGHVTADTAGLVMNDWQDGGRLDLLLDDVPSTAEFNARTLAAAAYFDPTEDTVVNVDTVATCTTNTDMISDPMATVVPGAYNAGEAGYIIGNNIPALVGGRVDANVSAINNVAAAAVNHQRAASLNIHGIAASSLTTTTMVSDIAVTQDDQYKGRTIIFANDTTTPGLRGTATDITACTASTDTLTFTALLDVPAVGETFEII